MLNLPEEVHEHDSGCHTYSITAKLIIIIRSCSEIVYSFVRDIYCHSPTSTKNEVGVTRQLVSNPPQTTNF